MIGCTSRSTPCADDDAGGAPFAARVQLLALYAAALSLPAKPEPGEHDAGVASSPTEGWCDFGAKDDYYEVFDPYVLDEPVGGSMSDDLLDVYRDVRRGLTLWVASHTTEAIWEWRFSFDAHWGDHAVDALRALHRACNTRPTANELLARVWDRRYQSSMRWFWTVLMLGACGDNDPGSWRCGDRAELLYGDHAWPVWGENVAVAGDRVYFTLYDNENADALHQVVSASVACGSEPTVVWAGGPHELFGSGMVVHGDRVYWTQQSTPAGSGTSIFSAPLAGGERVELQPVAGPRTFASDDQAIYVQGNGTLLRVPFDGSTASAIGDPLIPGAEIQWIEMHGHAVAYTISGAAPMLAETDLGDGHTTTWGPFPDYHGGQFDVDDTAFYLPSDNGIEVQPFTQTSPHWIAHADTRWSAVIRGPDGFYGFETASNGIAARLSFDGSTLHLLIPAFVGTTLVRDGDTIYAGSLGALYALHAGL